MANQTVYPYGTEGILPASVGIINDKYTGGADKAWSAEQGKLISESILQFTEVVLSGISDTSSYISYSTGKWLSQPGSTYKCKLFQCIPGDHYLVKANASRYSYVSVLYDNTHTANTDAHFSTGWSVSRIDAGEIYEFTVPSDGQYIYVAALNNGNDCSPQFFKQFEEKTDLCQDDIDDINSRRIDTDLIQAVYSWLINAENKWQNISGSNDYAYKMVPITPGKKYVVCPKNNSLAIAILSSDSKSNNSTPSFCTEFGTRINIKSNGRFIFTAPDTAAYLYVAIKTTAGIKEYSVAESMPISEQLAGLDNGAEATKDKFETAPEYYAWKKAEQMLNLKWTPLKAVPKSNSGNFSANTEQTGTPYSSVGEYDKRVGEDVSIYTFMTALHNPYSLIYTENVRSTSSQSAYGITYYGPSNSAMYYGVVCSGFTSYALGLIPFPTRDFASLAEQGIFEKVYDQSANGVRRGDLLWQEGHVLFVQDVWRKNGVVTNVLVTEQWQPLCRVRGLYTASGFNSFIKTESIIIYRYAEIYKNIKYEQSPFVTVGDETPLPEIVYNNDICTFAGDKAAFLEGELIYIHCLNLDYPQMEIYKNDTLLETVTLASDSRASLTSDELAYAVNLSSSNLTYGKYKCRLKDSDTYSDYTYFEVINGTVTVDETYDIATYSSANAKAEFYYWYRYHNTSANQYFDMSPLPGNKSGTINVSQRSANHPMLKVLFRGDYGRVAAKWLDES